MSENEPDLQDVLNTWFSSFSRDLRTAFPGKVQSYDASKRTADIRPMVKQSLEDEDGNFVSEELPMLPSVPVLFPRMGAWSMTFPVAAGDWVLVIACESSIGHVRATGEIAEPGDLRRHHLSHAVALPGFFPSTPAPAAASTTALVIGKDGGVKVALDDDGVVHLASNPAAQFLALSNKVDAALSNIVSAFNSHGHGGNGASPPAVPLTPQGSTASTKVKGV
jgi:hypothetical protein